MGVLGWDMEIKRAADPQGLPEDCHCSKEFLLTPSIILSSVLVARNSTKKSDQQKIGLVFVCAL